MYTSDKTKIIFYIRLQVSEKFRNKILIFSFHSDVFYPLDTMSNEKASSFNFKGAGHCSRCFRSWLVGARLAPEIGLKHCQWKSHNAYQHCKLQALVYDILPSTAAVFSYAIGSRKLSANEQFFVGVQTVVSLLQTPQIKQDVSFIAANKVCTSTNKTTIV